MAAVERRRRVRAVWFFIKDVLAGKLGHFAGYLLRRSESALAVFGGKRVVFGYKSLVLVVKFYKIDVWAVSGLLSCFINTLSSDVN